jgi:hypothetical protein
MRLAPATLVALTVFADPAMTAGAADLSANQLAAARKLNTTKCAKCHKLYHPSDYSVPDWDAWMMKMAKKSKLKPEQTSLLIRYFDLRRAGAIPGERNRRQ